MSIEIRLGDVVRLRKPHPCGGYEWNIVRLGADIGLQCTTCTRASPAHPARVRETRQNVRAPRGPGQRRSTACRSDLTAGAVTCPFSWAAAAQLFWVHRFLPCQKRDPKSGELVFPCAGAIMPVRERQWQLLARNRAFRPSSTTELSQAVGGSMAGADRTEHDQLHLDRVDRTVDRRYRPSGPDDHRPYPARGHFRPNQRRDHRSLAQKDRACLFQRAAGRCRIVLPRRALCVSRSLQCLATAD